MACLDESQTITVFQKNENLIKQELKIQDAAGLSKDQRKKDWFGMGYPYFICIYDSQICCSSDYGVLLFKIE